MTRQSSQRIRGKLTAGAAGLTLTEVVVVIALSGLLLSMLLPAIQQSRASARGVQCRNHLRQIGLAAQAFHEQNGALETINTVRSILPQMSEAPTWEVLKSMDEALLRGRRVEWRSIPSPAAYICPADSLAQRSLSHVNYALNYGGTIGRMSGMYQPPRTSIKFSEISDGLSNTALFSERLVLLPDVELIPLAQARRDALRFLWGAFRDFHVHEEQLLAEFCLSGETRENAERGTFFGYFFHSYPPNYDHLLPPGQWSFSKLGVDGRQDGAISASSGHGHGVHLLFADGHVDFIINNVDLQIFRSLGTRASQELSSR